MRLAELRSTVTRLERTYAALRSTEGNPHHDAEGKFTSAGGEGAHHGPGKHHARRQKRKLRRHKAAQKVRGEYKKEKAELKASHRVERKERVQDERKERRELSREHAKERKSQAKEHAKERTAKLKQHAKEGPRHEKKWAKQREKVAKEQSGKFSKLERAEQAAKNTPKRHEREKAKLEAHIASGEHAKITARITADQAAKAKAAGKSKEEVEAIEARGRELAEKGATQSRERLATQHAAEKAKAESIPGLKERLAKQTQAKLKRIESGPARLAKHQERQLKAMGRRQKSEWREQRGEHKEAAESLREDQREERQSIRERHKEERQDIVERYESELEEVGFKRKRKKAVTDGSQAVDTSRFGPPGDSGDHGLVRGESSGVNRAFSPYKTSKASSAEAILKHCLRQRGWSAAFRRGELSGKQQLDLLQDIREYARAWMRHEAEALFRQYGGSDVDTGLRGIEGVSGCGGSPHPGGSGSALALAGCEGSLLAGIGSDDRGGVPANRALSVALAHHVGRFFGRARQFIREAILAGAMALAGPAPLTADDLREADQQSDVQAAYLDRFHRDAHFRTPEEIAHGEPIVEPMTAAQFIARAEQYGDAPHAGAQAVERARMIRGRVYVEERRVHGRILDDMCATCAEAVRRGWVPIGTLPPIGDSECIGQCHCYFQWRDVDGNVAKTVRRTKGKGLAGRMKRRPVVAAT